MADFEIKKHWDEALGAHTARVLPGQYYVTMKSDECVATVLGSCVSACIRDPSLNLGGLNHFMLPGHDKTGEDSVINRYGTFAMENLINDILKLGGRKDRLEIKLFGGGRIMRGMTDVGAKNISFVRSFLAMEGFEVVAEDLGGEFSRKVIYFPSTGKVKVKRLRSVHTSTIVAQESEYLHQVEEEGAAGSIELFG